MLQNVGEILSVRDVVDDAFHNFMPVYQDYVLHKPYEGADNKTYKATSYIIGNLDSHALDEEMGTSAYHLPSVFISHTLEVRILNYEF